MSTILNAKVLFVGDKEGDAQQMGWLFSNIKKPDFDLHHVTDITALINQQDPGNADIFLLDGDLLNGDGLEKLQSLRKTFPAIPVVLLTEDEENVGHPAIRHGAQDFLIRSQLTSSGMARSLINAIERQRGQGPAKPSEGLLESATAVLNRLPMGVILVTSEAQVLFFNDKAKGFLDAGDGLILDRDRICRAEVPSENKLLGELLENALLKEQDASGDSDFAMSITRSNRDAPLTAMVAPIGTGIAGKGAVLFVSDPSEPVTLSVDTICRLYGLTPAEGRLTLGLTNGHKLDDLAEEWGVSMHTVRSQLRQVFRKTDTSRQSELVKLILTGPAALQATPIL
ncbi:response regulator [Sneathiella chinensis]|uniref:Response regulatory domain-containing protein n=1 Tax=Sneathiella chinensis TaxID=349750 RepID=A0ABQ5U2Q6_9PROT|nr:response regulator [Sneathiella chinensis]GLQ06194.1 hypothetical protein GCM10007924_14150 [Sneathiella chinensis]